MSSGFGRGPVPGTASRQMAAGLSPRTAVLRMLMPHDDATWRLDGLSILIGRPDPPQCIPTIALGQYDDAQPPSVSRRHAELYWEDGKLWLSDLGSTNGTWVNGQPLASPGLRQPSQPVELRAGDRLRFGAVECEIMVAA